MKRFMLVLDKTVMVILHAGLIVWILAWVAAVTLPSHIPNMAQA